MLKSLLYWLTSIIPQIAFPSQLNDIILGFAEYAYWANYYLPIDVVLKCFSIVFGYYITFTFIKFSIHSLDSTIDNLGSLVGNFIDFFV